MKNQIKMALAVLTIGIVGAFAVKSFATQVNPTSNVLGDTAATAGTLVLRNGSGNISVVTADIATDAVTTAKISLIGFSGQAGKLLCITTALRIGYCSTAACDTCN